MSLNLSTRLAHAWNAFTSRDPTQYIITGPGYSLRPDRPRLSRGNEKSIATSIFNRIALDVSSVNIKHCRLMMIFPGSQLMMAMHLLKTE